eukprot:CAMPEP_0173072872 /NCGR_PEP_ID=MMETSP1102-20130122/10068_1 /TAXON_ID=49646 /ORGANISM="Geminigera sp., Strain Caron Lab Isolate" /LENGTH=117 /DNA_ID=CAMNT_0013941609 /DNA_START=307 /DNA_END=657 /DNA_ORIENTATION=+
MACTVEAHVGLDVTSTWRQRGNSSAKSPSKWGIQIEELGETSPAEILEGRLYIASAVQASNYELVTNLDVTHIVNCSRSCNFDGTGTNPFSATIAYCSIGFADNATSDLTEALEQTW